MRNILRVGLICISIFALSACKTNEEEADAFYQSGLSLLAAGDLDRAAIEFLNVFRHDGFHQDARKKLADIRLQQGDIPAAYGQYLRLIEQYPDTPEVRLTLAGIAIDINNWDEARRHGQAAIALVPDNPKAQSISTALAYRDGTLNDDTAALDQAAVAARSLLDANPEDEIARSVVIDSLIRGDTPMDAMPELDRALERNPASYPYHTARLWLLTQAEDLAGVGVQLERMVTLFPDDTELTQSLIGWYLAQDDLAGAETYLRARADDITGPTDGHVVVVQFLQGTQGSAAANQELDRLAAANAGTPNADVYRSLSAAIQFEAGETDAAITTFQNVLSRATPSDQTNRIRNTFARLLIATGDRAGARAEVEVILSQDPSNVEALKLRAAWLIAEDRADQAILDLRTALGQQPRDAEVLTLMAQAHEREGNRALAGERLALAADITNGAPTEAIRYADFLLVDGRAAAARSVLTDALTTNPNNLDVLTLLARILLGEGAWIEAQNIANTLRGIETPIAQAAATSLQAALLLGQNRIGDSLAFLEAEIEQGSANVHAISQVVQIHLRSGNLDTARSYLDQALIDNPNDSTLQMMNASFFAIAGEFDASEAAFRNLIAAFPQAEAPVLRLYNLLISTNQAAKADAVIEASLQAQPSSLNLRWIRAGQLEGHGDIEGAIALYEEIYAADSSAVAIANNLASLIATHKDDLESIARAATIAKRLRELDVPAFQDTYGWIAYRQRNLKEARTYLEPAAKGLPDDPLVQYHLGMTYADLGEIEKAIAQLTRAVALAGQSTLPQIEIARAKLLEIQQ
jgi:tetratricopeptide (TPR) repeat protein